MFALLFGQAMLNPENFFFISYQFGIKSTFKKWVDKTNSTVPKHYTHSYSSF